VRFWTVGLLFVAGVTCSFYEVAHSGRLHSSSHTHTAKQIELMMKLNTFEPAKSMPEPVPIDEKHPFVALEDSNSSSSIPTKQYVANLPERKEWQKKLPTQDVAAVFKAPGKMWSVAAMLAILALSLLY
jgi:hypothetical protein